MPFMRVPFSGPRLASLLTTQRRQTKAMGSLRWSLMFCWIGLAACGDDSTQPPFDADTPADAGPLQDAGPLMHPHFECTVSGETPQPRWEGAAADGYDIAIAGGSPLVQAQSDARVVVSAGAGLLTFDANSELPGTTDTLTAVVTSGLGTARGLVGLSDGRLWVGDGDRDELREISATGELGQTLRANGGWDGAGAIALDAAGRFLVAGTDAMLLAGPTGGETNTFANQGRGDVVPRDVDLDEMRNRIYVVADGSIEIFQLSNLAHVARVELAGARSIARDRFGYLYVATGDAVVLFDGDSLQEIQRLNIAADRIAIGGEWMATLSEGTVQGYGLGEVQAGACIAASRVEAPSRVLAGHLHQLRVEVQNPDGEIDRRTFRRQGRITVGDQTESFFLYSGVGVAPLRISDPGAAEVQIEVMGFSHRVMVDVIAEPTDPPLTGELTDLSWGPEDGVIHLSGTTVVPAGETLTLAAGTLVWMDEGALLRVEGDLRAEGRSESPIAIVGPADGPTWSQIHHVGDGTYHYAHVFVAGGGNHADAYSYRRWKHCCPPVLYVEAGTLTMEDSVIGDTVNKALMVSDGNASLSGCAVQRVGMGPEFEAPTVRIQDVWVSEVRGIDDNDGIYFWKVGQCCAVPTDVCTISCGAPYPQTSVEVDGLVLADGDDDGLDTQMSFASVGGDTHPMSPILRNVTIYGWADKGMSLAGGNAWIEDALVVFNNNLGIKADDNDPRSETFPDVRFDIRQSTVAHNVNHGLFFGVQGGMTDFGDGSHMTMSVEDSVIYGNAENAFRHYDVSTFESRRSVFPGAPGTTDNVQTDDPRFIDPVGGDFRLSPLAPAATLAGGDPVGSE